MVDFSKCLYNPSTPNTSDVLKDEIPEFNNDLGDVERFRWQIVKFVIMMYDVASPLRKIYPNIHQRRREAATLAGFKLSTNLEFPKKVEGIILGEDKRVTPLIIGYILKQGLPELLAMEACMSQYIGITDKMLQKNADKNDIDQHRKLLADLKMYEEEVFRGREAVEIRRALYTGMEGARKPWRPEDVAQKLKDNPDDTLEDGNPYSYGEEYKVKPLKFIGDEEPV